MTLNCPRFIKARVTFCKRGSQPFVFFFLSFFLFYNSYSLYLSFSLFYSLYISFSIFYSLYLSFSPFYSLYLVFGDFFTVLSFKIFSKLRGCWKMLFLGSLIPRLCTEVYPKHGDNVPCNQPGMPWLQKIKVTWERVNNIIVYVLYHICIHTSSC